LIFRIGRNLLNYKEVFSKSAAIKKLILIWVVMVLVVSCAIKPVSKIPPPYPIGRVKADGYQLVPILCYHDFGKKSRGPIQLTAKEFQEQMEYLKNNEFKVITLESFFNFINMQEGLPEKSVVITIDDGWRFVYTIAYPILKRYGFPATLFIYTDFISNHSPAALTWEMIKEMSENGIDIQAHSKSHQRDMPWKKENETGKEVKYIAYTYGQFNEAFIQAAKMYGYKGGLTVAGAKVKQGIRVKQTVNHLFVDPFEVRRVQVIAKRGLKRFAKKLRIFRHEIIYDGRYDNVFCQ
jgi:peptidoglycan/xylan/chitin deacetylase (PgdA/CDA1 family)